jgi:hypothetical protein
MQPGRLETALGLAGTMLIFSFFAVLAGLKAMGFLP